MKNPHLLSINKLQINRFGSVHLLGKISKLIYFYSGPYRFDYDMESHKWVGKNKLCLLDLLNKELSEAFGDDVKLVYENSYL